MWEALAEDIVAEDVQNVKDNGHQRGSKHEEVTTKHRTKQQMKTTASTKINSNTPMQQRPANIPASIDKPENVSS